MSIRHEGPQGTGGAPVRSDDPPKLMVLLRDTLRSRHVSASTQNQALCALLFLYRHVFGYDVGNVGDVVRARKSHRVPIVMTREEARSVLAQMSGDTKLMASLL